MSIKQGPGQLPLKLLLNAEPFGFGPAAAVAGFLPHLRPHFEKVGYVGKKHTLDLQRGLPYDAVHDVSAMMKEERAETLAPIFAQYDIFLTAMDSNMAGRAKDAGLQTYYYDALAWYWPKIPSAVTKGDLYLAQDFFGVKARVADAFNGAASEAHVVPPIVPQAGENRERSNILISLGGLQNPFWLVEGVVDYARAVIASLRQAIPAGEEIVIAGSRVVAEKLQDEGVRTFPRKEMEGVLGTAKAAFMTPGLGNIYDAAGFNIPTVWLPPANDSQGRQMELLRQNGMLDAGLDWPEITGRVIDYRAEQRTVLARIAETTDSLTTRPEARKNFTRLAAASLAALGPDSRTTQLIGRFGRGGEEKVAEQVVRKARQFLMQGARHG